jgi:hypothetical protein
VVVAVGVVVGDQRAPRADEVDAPATERWSALGRRAEAVVAMHVVVRVLDVSDSAGLAVVEYQHAQAVGPDLVVADHDLGVAHEHAVAIVPGAVVGDAGFRVR